MSNCDCYCDCQESINDNEATVAATVTEKPIGDDGLLITTMASTTVGIFFGLKTMGAAQHDALLTSTSFVRLMSFPCRKR